MNFKAILDMLTKPLAKGIMRVTAAAGISGTLVTEDRATQVASALVTLGAFAIECFQWWYSSLQAKKAAEDAAREAVQNAAKSN